MDEKPKSGFVKHTVKDSVFSELFSIPAYQVELLRALYPDAPDIRPEDIQNVTIKNVVANDVYNDLGLLFRGVLVVLAEAQSVMTPNILVRFIEYIARSYKDHLVRTGQDWYARSRVEIPRTDLYVVYVGSGAPPECDVLDMTEIFFGGEPCGINIRARVIWEPKGKDALSQYIRFSHVSNETVAALGRTREAAERIVKTCISQGILPEFFDLADRRCLQRW